MSKRKPTSPPPAKPAADSRDQVIAALQQDQGPVVMTVAVSMINGKVTVSGIMRNEGEMRAIQEGLLVAQREVQSRIERAVEARIRGETKASVPQPNPASSLPVLD